METICKKCIERGEKRWNPTKTEEYKKLLGSLKWFSNVSNKNNNNTLINIAGQLQLIEFIQQIYIDCKISDEDNWWYNEETGDNYTGDSEIESILTKQEACAVGAVVEAICYTMLRHNKIDFKKIEDKKTGLLKDSTEFVHMLELIEKNKLLPKDEISLCHQIRKLRNKVHLFDQIETDVETFSRNEADLAEKCLYFLLQRWLNASDEAMQIYFSFLPVASKEILPGNISDFF